MLGRKMTFCVQYWKTPEVHVGDHSVVDYCTSLVEGSNDAGSVLVPTACREDHNQRSLSNLLLCYHVLCSQIVHNGK